MSASQQPQQQTPALPVRQRKSATPTNIPVPTSKALVREVKAMQQEIVKNPNYSDTDDDEQDYFEDESDVNLSKEERFVLLQPRAEPQGQENLSGNVTPVNDNQQREFDDERVHVFEVFNFSLISLALFRTKHLRESLIESTIDSAKGPLLECLDRCHKHSTTTLLKSQCVGRSAQSQRQQRKPTELPYSAATSTALKQKLNGPFTVKPLITGCLAVELLHTHHS
jgi:hypothetical protein